MQGLKMNSKERAIWDAHFALRRMGYNDFDYITLAWLLGHNTQGCAALEDVLTDEDIRTCEQLCGPNGHFIFKVLEARREQRF